MEHAALTAPDRAGQRAVGTQDPPAHARDARFPEHGPRRPLRHDRVHAAGRARAGRGVGHRRYVFRPAHPHFPLTSSLCDPARLTGATSHPRGPPDRQAVADRADAARHSCPRPRVRARAVGVPRAPPPRVEDRPCERARDRLREPQEEWGCRCGHHRLCWRRGGGGGGSGRH